jgi:hypothetical protein
MENSPPGIHTMPSGAGLDGFEELATVGAKDEVSFAAEEAGSTAYALKASASTAAAVNGRSLVSFIVACFFLVRLPLRAVASIADVVEKIRPPAFWGNPTVFLLTEYCMGWLAPVTPTHCCH